MNNLQIYLLKIYLQFPKEIYIHLMMHAFEKVVHIKIEKLIITIGKTIRGCSIILWLVFVGQCLTNKHNIRIHNIIILNEIYETNYLLHKLL